MSKRTILRMTLAAAALAAAGATGAAGCSPVVRTYGGTGGGDTSCTPGETVPCYEGPAGTQNVGACKAGAARCGDDGKPGACEGQVMPAPLDPRACGDGHDLDCDGEWDACPLDYIWGHAYGVAGGKGLSIVNLDLAPGGDAVISGTTDAQLDFGMGPLTTASLYGDVFVARVDPAGKTIWAKKFGDASESQSCSGTKVDAQGNIFLAGAYAGALDGLDLPVPPSAGSDDAFVIKLDPMGNGLWARWGGDQDSQGVDALGLTPEGDVIAAGHFRGTLAWSGGGQTLTSAAINGEVVFVQRFDTSGNAMWTTQIGDNSAANSDQRVSTIAVDLAGDVILTGQFSGTLQLPDGTSHTSNGNSDLFVVKLHGADGKMIWGRVYGGADDENGIGVATDAQGNVLVSGAFVSTLTMDGQTVTTMNGQTEGLYLAKLTPAGQVTWLRGFGSGSQINGMFVGVGENDSILLAGAFDGTIDFGGGLIDPKSPMTVAGFLAKLDSGGNYLAARLFKPGAPTPGSNFPSLVLSARTAVVPGTNEILSAGLIIGQTDLGGGVVGIPDTFSPFLARYAP
jgi:hypothetical protein